METLGLIEEIIAYIAGAPKAPFSKNKIVVEERRLLDFLEKLKLLVQTEGQAARRAVNVPQLKPLRKEQYDPQAFGAEGEPLIRQAKQKADALTREADEYADHVLAHLQVVISKWERTLCNGREVLKKRREDAR
ncbi:MAG: hypothetical protein LBD62_01505 [Candidatus Margulisbacteria bacterium]|jgi:hypothetical protein|nr:hypothetical protein [Candidatus Margulisiibacteriota bacterium]